MHVVVVRLDLVLDGADFEGDSGPFALPRFDETLDGFVVVVGAEGHVFEVVEAEFLHPLDGLGIAFGTADERHEVWMLVGHEPRPGAVVQVQRVAGECQLGIAVLHQPIADFAVA